MTELIYIILAIVALYWTTKLLRLSGGFTPWAVYALLVFCELLRRLTIYLDPSTINDPDILILIAILLALFPYTMWRALNGRID